MPTPDVGYMLLMFAAVLTCTSLLRRSQASLPLSTDQKFGLGVGAFFGAMLGAKLPFVLADWEGLLSGAAWFANGKTIMFGIVGGYVGVEIAKAVMGIRIRTGDTFAAPVAFSVAIGRLACFRAGCCYGVPSTLPWAVAFPSALEGPTVLRHPTQLYEALFHFSLGVLLLVCQRRQLLRGQLMKFYLISYLAYRFATEFIRPEPAIWFGLTGYQVCALIMIAAFSWLWIRDRRAPDETSADDECSGAAIPSD